MATKRRASLQLFDFTDDEFLAVIQDNGDDEGWVRTEELAVSVGLTGDDRNRNLGSRLSWMRRFGCVERDIQPGSPTKGAWRLTEMGRVLANSRLRASVLKNLGELEDGEMWEAWRTLCDLSLRVEGPTFQMMRRSTNVAIFRRRFG